MTISRRTLMKTGLGAGAALLLERLPAAGRALPPDLTTTEAAQAQLLRRPIPSSGEQIPVIGLGTGQTFNLTADNPRYGAARDVLRAFHELGGKLVDTSPTYGESEPFLGRAVQDFGLASDLFLATKVNVQSAGKAAALRQMEESARVLGKSTIDLMQVWNLGDTIRNLSDRFLTDHLEAITEWKASGRARYIGITTSRDPQYADVEAALTRYPLDFVQLDYSIGDRVPEQRLLPLAREKGIAVIANRPFTTGNLFGAVAGKPVPEWAEAFDCRSWAQFFLKFIISHPAVTCTIPATSNPAHVRDNMGAGVGRLPDEPTRQRMIAHFGTL